MIPPHVLGVIPPPQADAVGHGAVPVGVPEGQQTVPMALRNQLETIVGDLQLAYGRLGQLPPQAMEPGTFSSLQSQYATLMDIAGQLTARLNGIGPALGEDLGLAKEINRLQGDAEMFIGAVESTLMQLMAAANASANEMPPGHHWEVETGTAVLENPEVVTIPPVVLNPQITVPGGGNGGNGNGLAPVAQAGGRPWLRWGLVLGALLLIGGGTYYYYRQQRGVTAAF